MLDDVIFHGIFRMVQFACELLRKPIVPGITSKIKRMTFLNKQSTGRLFPLMKSCTCASLHILGGSSYIDACWGFNAGTISV